MRHAWSIIIISRLTGLKVDWKFFGALNQYRSHVQNSEPAQQPEPAHSQQQSQLGQQQLQSQLVQIEPDQSEQTSYLQHQTQVEPQQIVPNRIQYKTVVVEAPQPVEEQPEPNQLRYRVYPQAEAQPVEAQPVEAQPVEAQPVEAVQYSRYSNAPARAKQVILEEFKPPSIHPDPSSYYPTSSNVQDVPQYGQQPTNAVQYEQPEQQKSRRGFQVGKIVYKSDYEQQEEQVAPQSVVERIEVPVESLPSPIPQKLVIDRNMPMEIQQLLQYQARLPYEVIANSISSKPRSLFIPKPLPAETKGPYHYRSKIYYVNNDEYEADIGATKPVEENQRH